MINTHNAADVHGGAQRWRNEATRRQVALVQRLRAAGKTVLLTGDMNEKKTYFCKMTRAGTDALRLRWVDRAAVREPPGQRDRLDLRLARRRVQPLDRRQDDPLQRGLRPPDRGRARHAPGLTGPGRRASVSPWPRSLLISRRDLDFLLYEWLGVEDLLKRERYAEHGRDSFDAVLDLSEQLATEVFAPANRVVDAHEPYVGEDGKVVLPDEVGEGPRGVHRGRASRRACSTPSWAGCSCRSWCRRRRRASSRRPASR